MIHKNTDDETSQSRQKGNIVDRKTLLLSFFSSKMLESSCNGATDQQNQWSPDFPRMGTATHHNLVGPDRGNLPGLWPHGMDTIKCWARLNRAGVIELIHNWIGWPSLSKPPLYRNAISTTHCGWISIFTSIGRCYGRCSIRRGVVHLPLKAPYCNWRYLMYLRTS